MENKGYAKFGGGSNKVHYSGKCGSGVLYVKCIDREGWGNSVQGLGKDRPNQDLTRLMNSSTFGLSLKFVITVKVHRSTI